MKLNDKIEKGNPFKVPEGYFDSLTDRTMAAIREEEIRNEWWGILSAAARLGDVAQLKATAESRAEPERSIALELCTKREGQIRGSRGARSNGGQKSFTGD